MPKDGVDLSVTLLVARAGFISEGRLPSTVRSIHRGILCSLALMNFASRCPVQKFDLSPSQHPSVRNGKSLYPHAGEVSVVLQVWKFFQQSVGNPVYLLDGVFYNPVPFCAGLNMYGNVQFPSIFIVLHVMEQCADRLEMTDNTGKIGFVETPPQRRDSGITPYFEINPEP